MTISSEITGSANPMPLRKSWDLIAIGMVLYALLATGLLKSVDGFPLGQNLYDEYFLALLDGRMDLPARVAQFEGHYTPDGIAYLYHGVGPLIPRFVFGWIWPFETYSLAPLAIWLWSCLGTLGLHAAFHKATSGALEQLGSRGLTLSRMLGIAIWFGSPGFLLCASTSFYHEPIALAFAATSLFILIWANVAFGEWPLWKTAIPCAALAALALHARPNVAIGLYFATILALGLLAWMSLRIHFLRIVIALAIMGAGGAGYLGLNAARFGSPTETHGSFSQSDVQYGFVYWGAEDTDSERAQAFKDHGKFNIKRIPHNATIYLFDIPAVTGQLQAVSEAFHASVRSTLAQNLGFIRVESPYVGMVFLWPLWILFAVSAPAAGGQVWRRMAIPLAGGFAIAGLTLAYGTITLRYRVDLWPLLALLALLGASAIAKLFAQGKSGLFLKGALIAAFLIGIAVSASTVAQLRGFQMAPQSKPFWSMEECRHLTGQKDFSDADIERICRPPRIGH